MRWPHSLGFVWPTVALLVAPCYIITQGRELLQQSLRYCGGSFSRSSEASSCSSPVQELPYQWLWMVTAGGIIAKGAFLSIGTHSWREPVIDWCVGRKDVGYRFWGLGHCALAVLLLHALGWIGRS